MKYLGIDYGTKLVGTAVSNQEGTIAFPRASYPNDAALVETIAQLVQENQIERIVVGDTRSSGGHANPVTAEAESFMQALRAGVGIDVVPVVEVWTSIEASRYAPKDQAHDDSAAAAIILQRYLDMRPGAPALDDSFE